MKATGRDHKPSHSWISDVLIKAPGQLKASKGRDSVRKAVGRLGWFWENDSVAVAVANGQEEANSIGAVKEGSGALG